MCLCVCIDYIYIYKIINFIYYIYFMCIIKKRTFSGILHKPVERGHTGGRGIASEEDTPSAEAVAEAAGCRGHSRTLAPGRRGYERTWSSSGALNSGPGTGSSTRRCHSRRCPPLDRFCEGGAQLSPGRWPHPGARPGAV